MNLPAAHDVIHPYFSIGDQGSLTCNCNKSCARGRYLIVTYDGPWSPILKFTGSQLCRTSYRVKGSELYKVPTVPY